MAIEWLERNSGLIVPTRPSADIPKLNIELDQEALPQWRKWMNDQDLAKDSDRLLSMKHPWAFVVGALTRRINPLLGRLPDDYIYTIHGIRMVCDKEGIATYECHSREDWGAKAILAKDASERDGYAIKTSDLIIVLAGSSISRNTPKEIRYATELGRPLIALQNQHQPEEDFMRWIRRRITYSPATLSSVLISYKEEGEMHKELAEVLFRFKQELGFSPKESQVTPSLIA